MTYANYQDFKARKPLRWWHEAIIDDMLAFPTATLAERSKRLHYSESYLSMIMNSDMFKAAYNARRKLFNERLDQSIVTKTQMAADRAMDIILETLDSKRGALPFAQVADFADKTLSRLGYGLQKGPAVAVNVDNRQQTLQVSKDDLASAREKLRGMEEQRALAAPLPRLGQSGATPPEETSETVIDVNAVEIVELA